MQLYFVETGASDGSDVAKENFIQDIYPPIVFDLTISDGVGCELEMDEVAISAAI